MTFGTNAVFVSVSPSDERPSFGLKVKDRIVFVRLESAWFVLLIVWFQRLGVICPFSPSRSSAVVLSRAGFCMSPQSNRSIFRLNPLMEMHEVARSSECARGTCYKQWFGLTCTIEAFKHLLGKYRVGYKIRTKKNLEPGL